MTQQPTWKCIANLGDADPVEHGGAFVYVDATGVYDAELELLEPPVEGSGRGERRRGARWTVHRFTLEPCTYAHGVLSDNSFHPRNPAWFADSLEEVSAYAGYSCESNFRDLLCSDSPIVRATAYRDIVGYFGAHEFDSYPRQLTETEASALADQFYPEREAQRHRAWYLRNTKTIRRNSYDE